MQNYNQKPLVSKNQFKQICFATLKNTLLEY